MYDAVKVCNHPDVQNKLNLLIQQLKTKLQSQSARNLQLLTNNDFTIIAQYVKVMEPIAQSLDIMQKELNSSQGLILPVLYTMKHRIEQMDEKINIGRDFKLAMLKAIDFRFKNYFFVNDTNKDLLLASASLPRIKCNFLSNDEHIIYVKSILVAECKKIRNDNVEETIDVPKIVPNPEPDDDFLISFAQQHSHRRTSMDNDIESEVSRFIVDDRKENTILNDYPHIREVYFKYNTTLSSSAPVERVFSQSEMMYRPRRNRLRGDHFEQALLLKHNQKLLEANKIYL